jgi:hypothetical protein
LIVIWVSAVPSKWSDAESKLVLIATMKFSSVTNYFVIIGKEKNTHFLCAVPAQADHAFLSILVVPCFVRRSCSGKRGEMREGTRGEEEEERRIGGRSKQPEIFELFCRSSNVLASPPTPFAELGDWGVKRLGSSES